MKVKQLEIDSFRGIRNLTLYFDLKEPTVFLGVNGSSKSSILDCLAILLSWFNVGMQDLHREGNDFTDSDINNQSKKTENKITIYIDESESVSWSLRKIRDDWRVQARRTLRSFVNSINQIIFEFIIIKNFQRAVKVKNGISWFWIGTHAQYDKLIN